MVPHDNVTTSTSYVSLRDHINYRHSTSQDERLLFPRLLREQLFKSVWSLESLAIPMTYISTGLLYSFPQTMIEIFPRSIGASDAQLNTVAVVRALPWTFKVLLGVLPDLYPISNQRYAPYLGLGCLLASIFHILLAIYTATNTLTLFSFTFLLFGATIGVVMADVMADALVAHRVVQGLQYTKSGPFDGSYLQTTVSLCRFGSEIFGYWLGACLNYSVQWGYTTSMMYQFAFLACVPLVMVLPALTYLTEHDERPMMSLQAQMKGLWLMLQRRATWQPVCFLVLVNSCFVPNAAWGNYLKVAYHFTGFQYGAISGIGACVTFVAIQLYRSQIVPYFDAPWHHVFYTTGIVIAFFSLLNIFFVFHVNDQIGLSPFWFAMGDAAGSSFARGFQYLPVAQMFVAVCPMYQEGVAFALLTSITNVAQAIATTIANILLTLWPVDLQDLEKVPHDYQGVWKLSILTSIISIIPVIFLTTRWLPKGPQEQQEWKHDFSTTGAAFVLVIYAGGFLWVCISSLLAIFAPCHVLVGGHGC
ncbi:Major facilitator superfamily domain, general substrate transporter [Plasmopara halstedii]|uniref:Major facilitator superfamily domain, general substrate transporter n=1 Tax=Plasmopara halstedii TaxID=4781 RepID=A0A0N7L4X8_PLAHL|nr:Major facilitator superfamily domain, general substrate transporter [Plasmopara halstedii]CEG39915.1 Major facilitator superfamily domain, general substrate transporter [Plasmopara halstedii]|eukprot:XP_024576284.1 Major facilitator superfamily domain, general substrate transporter [Plasmopara halstedii]